MTFSPVTLSSSTIRLEPLSLAHLPGLIAVGLEPSLWKISLSVIQTPEQMRAYVESALEDQAKGTALPFATVLQATGQVIGSSRFANIALKDRRVEIGWTWITPAWQRTAVNTEAKLLMMTHAFETVGCHRVELKTNALNLQSRNAMKRLGCVEEGTLRQHAISDAGVPRDTVYYSILLAEWPIVKARLMERLAREA